jgi:hypothetical protein
MAKPTEFFDLGLPEKTTFLKDGLRKKTTADHWALLECSKVNGLFTKHEPERNNLAANYEAENLHIAFQHASDMGQWKKYLQDHPPSPEALAVLMLLAAEEHAKSFSESGLEKRHKENRDMKAEAFIWLDQNRANYKSMDDVAMAIKELSPIKFRTARDWVAEWKKLRSPGKP